MWEGTYDCIQVEFYFDNIKIELWGEQYEKF